MGNSGSSSSKVRQKSDSMDFRDKPHSARDFNKSKSMMDMGTRGQPPASARQKSITSIKEKERPKSARDAKTTPVNNVARQKSMRKEISHPITGQAREIITQCFDNPHSEFANKVLQRIFEKRLDYQKFIMQLGKEKSSSVNIRLKELIEEVVAKIHDPEVIDRLSRQYGEDHVELKQYGFKPDFWVAIADAMTLEGVILDMASHQPADTVSAWSSLVTMMFSAVRDGYYTALRRHRMSSRRQLKHQNTIDSKEEDGLENGGMNTVDTVANAPVATMRSISMYAANVSNSMSGSSTSLNRSRESPVSAPNALRRRPIFE
ncbi:unnamed protein product [Caenorhabditis auriculariae]|uniref:Uncharacterized protein n=1 Tax=Caenorhabditis auriculariae TaxID=2777116 RepID=A0A8S1H6W1_9PELO|nr:unnamed protein product [Caenorhabditis auriculariae]